VVLVIPRSWSLTFEPACHAGGRGFESRPLRHHVFCRRPLRARGRLWRFKYRFPSGGPEKLLALGAYPEVSLKEARDDRDEARSDLRKGIDPAVKRRAEAHSPANTFKAVALELFAILRKASLAGANPPQAADEVVHRTIQPHRKRKARRREPISADTIDTMQRRLEAHIFPYVGGTDVAALTGPDLLLILRRIESRGTFELAHRVRSICSRVLRYSRATGRKCEDVAADLIGLLVPVESEQMAAIIEPLQIGQLLRSMAGYAGEPLTRLALNLVPYIFPRPIEFRMMEWAHIALDGPAPEWSVPWRRMKMRNPHIVPLSRQAAGCQGAPAAGLSDLSLRIRNIARNPILAQRVAECLFPGQDCSLQTEARPHPRPRRALPRFANEHRYCGYANRVAVYRDTRINIQGDLMSTGQPVVTRHAGAATVTVRYVAGMLCLTISLIGASRTASAQEQTPPPRVPANATASTSTTSSSTSPDVEPAATAVVTGTSIQSVDSGAYQSAPVSVITADSIQKSGAASLESYFQTQPDFVLSGQSS
jgi:hypothetical protein